ncbi:MAG: MerR family transcriptional regulator [Eubacterium sp.]|nr:MerR family transcriptional regulator [Eubacterium sp.]
MTLNEASEKFSIDIERLKFYEDNGLLRCEKIVNGTPNYTEKELRKVGVIHSLEKAGFNVQMIRQYLTLTDGGQKEEKIRLLRKQRCRLLEEIHGKQQSLDELDYMISEIKKETF